MFRQMRVGRRPCAGFIAVSTLLIVGVGITGCEPLAITALGVGASTGVTHTLGGITYRTFTAPMSKVRSATMAALGNMSIKVSSTSRIENGEMIKAKAGDREIEIQLESISPNTTRMRSIARNGILYDSATATEIILQTERLLVNA